jgi:hypothetical protein
VAPEIAGRNKKGVRGPFSLNKNGDRCCRSPLGGHSRSGLVPALWWRGRCSVVFSCCGHGHVVVLRCGMLAVSKVGWDKGGCLTLV